MPLYEMYIQPYDNTSPNPDVDKACYRQGDIVCVENGGHGWTPEEKRNVVKIDFAGTLQEIRDSYCTVNFSSDGHLVKRRRDKYCDVSPDPNLIKTIQLGDLKAKAAVVEI